MAWETIGRPPLLSTCGFPCHLDKRLDKWLYAALGLGFGHDMMRSGCSRPKSPPAYGGTGRIASGDPKDERTPIPTG